MPEAQPVISIIMPCYNYGRFLADSLNGVIAQEFSDWECILIDDGSTDDTAAVGEAYMQKDPRIRYLHQANAGVCAARNTAMKLVRGRFIQFLDSDDSIAPEKLRLQHEYLLAHPEADLVYGDALYFNESVGQLTGNRTDHPQRSRHLRTTACGMALLPMLCEENIMEISAPLFRTALMEKVGVFDTKFKSFEDWHYWFRCALAGACFHYWPVAGTETYIRYGHPSLMSNLPQMNQSGAQFRKYMQPYFRGRLGWYNRYRRLRLAMKRIWLRLNT
jgi:glycosyltransferase involved in cell wall biosynthesis